MKRMPHFLKSPKSSGFPERIIVFDARPVIESECNAGGVKLCSLESWHMVCLSRDGDEYRVGALCYSTNKNTFWETVKYHMTPRKTTWMTGFGVPFQLGVLGLWEILEDGKWQLSGEDPLQDSLELLEQSNTCGKPSANVPEVSDCGKSYKRKKVSGICVLEDPPTILMITPNFGRSNLKIVDVRNYAVDNPPRTPGGFADVRALAIWFAAWCKTLVENNLGGLQVTAASQAMHSYKHSFMPERILVHTNDEALTLERSSLHCGRNECFRMGKVHGPIYHLDFNSFYAAVARDMLVPVRFMECGETDINGLNDLHSKGYGLFADVMIACHEPCYPLRAKDQLIFPVGSFRTTLAGPELSEAIDNDSIVKVYKVAIHEQDCIFRSWVDKLFSLRAHYRNLNDEAGEALCKRLMVSVFGKFAQWSWKWINRPDVDPICAFGEWWASEQSETPYAGQLGMAQSIPDPWDKKHKGRYIRWQSIAWNVRCEGPRHEHYESVPAIPAFIYSAARIRLLEAIRSAGWDNVFYCDADSLWTNKVGMRCLQRCGLLHDEELGKLKLKAEYPWVKFLGLKHYETPDKIVHSGVPSHATQVGERVWEFASTERFAGALAQFRAPQPLLITKTLDYRKPYRHGNVAVNGRVTPLVMGERW